ncbi:hypothetical protein MRX96_027874 [Rhipicephalus microplus]
MTANSQQLQLGLAAKLTCAGSAACIADAITFPLDVAKVRLQIQGEGSTGYSRSSLKYRGVLGTVATIARQEGPARLYGGIGPGLQRQFCFATVRIGFYDSVKESYSMAILGHNQGGNSASVLGIRILAAVTTGAMAVATAQPTDVVKVRMQAQSGTAPRRYRNSFQAYRTIGREEGSPGTLQGHAAQHRSQQHRQCCRTRVLRQRQGGHLVSGPAGGQHRVSLRGRLRSGLLRHCGRFARGRGQDALHERRRWSLLGRHGVCGAHVPRGRSPGLLQRVHTFLRSARFLEHLHVHHVRTAEATVPLYE